MEVKSLSGLHTEPKKCAEAIDARGRGLAAVAGGKGSTQSTHDTAQLAKTACIPWLNTAWLLRR